MPGPLILAGPILRRVEVKRVSVFLALSRPANVHLTIWPGSQVSSGDGTVQSPAAVAATGTAATRRFGENLHLVVVTAESAIGLPPGAFHSYDVVVEPTVGGGGGGLKAQKLLKDEAVGDRILDVDPAAPMAVALGYQPDRLPGFVTPAATVAQLRMAHASCRRANYAGWDAMAWLDDWMKQKIGDATEHWPQQLFLTGDQIYADDVSAVMLPMLTTMGQDLIGGTERFPIDATVSVPVNGASLPPLRRGGIVRGQAAMTTTASDCHLLGFGEYCAMYLAAWSTRAWGSLATDDAMFVRLEDANHESRPFLTAWETCHQGSHATWRAAALAKQAKDRERETVQTYGVAAAQAARAMANCSTYMIWDDHEVTDDWNLSGRWVARTYSRPAGRAIVRNGMIAYGLFQGWGNDPAAFAEDGNNKDFLTQAEAMFAGTGDRPVTSTIDRMEELLGFPTAAADRRARWHYKIDGPAHRVHVLDTRSRRDTGALGSIAPPKLLGDTLDAQLPAGPLTDGRVLQVVVSPAPVINPDLYDRVMAPVASGLTDVVAAAQTMFGDYDPCKALKRSMSSASGAEQFDAESWAGHQEHQEALFARMATYGNLVILSGDVHFAASLTLDYWKKPAQGASQGPAARIVQLTSSGARNGWPQDVEGQFRRNTVLQDLWTGVLVERLGWAGAGKLTLPAGAHIGPGRRARLKRSPALVPVTGWPAGTTVAEDPDWRWRIRLVSDVRTKAQGGPADPPLLAADLPTGASAGGAFAGYAAIVTRHQAMTMQHTPLMRTMMFASNVGLIGFSGADATLTLTHRLLSQTGPGAPTFAVNTLHEVSLASSSQPLPVLDFS